MTDRAGNLGQLLVEDTRQVMGSRNHWDRTEWAMAWAGAAAILGTGFLLDRAIDRWSLNHPNHVGLDRVAKDVEPLGSTAGILVAVGLYAGGAAFGAPEVKATGTDAMIAIAIAELGLVVPLKVLAGRSRPYSNEGTHAFHPFAGGVSFPSGHTTVSFALASVIAEHADNVFVSVASYGLAGLVGLARMEQRSHFLSDVVAGGLIGTFVGKVVVAHNQTLRFAARSRLVVTVTPALMAGGCGVTFSARF